MTQDKTSPHIKLDERNHVEKPLLDQLAGLDCGIIDLASKNHGNSYRQKFSGNILTC